MPVLVQIVGGGLFKRWTDMIGEDHWLSDERFATDQSRGDHGEIIGARMRAWCEDRTNEQALVTLAGAGIPCGELLSPQEVLENEHVVESDAFQPVDYPGLPSPAPLAQHPVRYSETPVGDFARAPLLGEHTDAIMAELGFGSEEIAKLRGLRII